MLAIIAFLSTVFCTKCPVFLYVDLAMNLGQDFLDIQHVSLAWNFVRLESI